MIKDNHLTLQLYSYVYSMDASSEVKGDALAPQMHHLEFFLHKLVFYV
jgi:hypothetical protein